MKITVEISIPFLDKNMEVSIPDDMALKNMVPLIFSVLDENDFEQVDIYTSDGKMVDPLMNAQEANIVTGMRLYLL